MPTINRMLRNANLVKMGNLMQRLLDFFRSLEKIKVRLYDAIAGCWSSKPIASSSFGSARR
jgi:hypothetical protein